jgi:hypothetical protein
MTQINDAKENHSNHVVWPTLEGTQMFVTTTLFQWFLAWPTG